MVAQILADALQRVVHLDAETLQQLRPANAGQFQQLWGINRAGADDDFPDCVCLSFGVYGWAAFFLAVGAANLAGGYWYLTIDRSASARP